MFHKWLNPFQLFFAPDGSAAGGDDKGAEPDKTGTDITDKKVENVSAKQYDKFLDDASVDDMDKSLDAIKKGSLTEADITKPLSDEEKAAKAEQDRLAAIEKAKAAPNPNELITVTDDYIAKAPEDERAFLEGIKGRKVEGQVLKNYVNAQRLISEYKSGRVKSEDNELGQGLKVNEDELTDDIKKQKSNFIFNKLKAKFPDMPDEALEDQTVLDEYAEGLTKMEFRRFESTLNEAETLANQTVASYVDLSKNWETYAINNITKDVTKFTQHLSKYGLTDKDLGLDLSINEKGGNPLLLSILFPDGKPDANIVKMMHGDIPVVMPDKVYSKLLESNMDKIIEIAKTKAHTAGFTARQGNEPDPSSAAAGIAGDNQRKANLDQENLKGVVVTDDDTLEVIDQKLNKLKTMIVNTSG